MKAIKFFILLFAILSLSLSSLFAQDSTPLNEEQKEEFIAEMKVFAEKLELSEEQQAHFKEISLKYAAQMNALKQQDISRYSKYTKLKAISKEKNALMKDFLTEEQYALYLDRQEENMEKIKERNKG